MTQEQEPVPESEPSPEEVIEACLSYLRTFIAYKEMSDEEILEKTGLIEVQDGDVGDIMGYMETFLRSEDLWIERAFDNHLYHLGIRDEEAEIEELARQDRLNGYSDELGESEEE